jgi:Ca2+-binding EF-hand superfamily protein
MLLLALPLITYQAMRTNNSECEEAPRQDRIRGNYENKIRFFSPPEKIFETFAHSRDKDRNLVMSYPDFFRALTPYNYTEIKDNKEYFEKYHPDILKVADSNNDGVISFPEFFFFITILQLPIGLVA